MNLNEFRATRQSIAIDDLQASEDWRVGVVNGSMADGGITADVPNELIKTVHLYWIEPDVPIVSRNPRGWTCLVERHDGKTWWYDWGNITATREEAEELSFNEWVNHEEEAV